MPSTRAFIPSIPPPGINPHGKPPYSQSYSIRFMVRKGFHTVIAHSRCCLTLVYPSTPRLQVFTLHIYGISKWLLRHEIFLLIHKIKLPKDTGTRTKNIKNEQKVGMLLQKRKDTRGVGISSMRKSIYLLTTTPSHTHRFHPLPLATPASCSPHPLSTPIHSTHSPQLTSILLTCAKFKVWMTIVESGEQEEGVASGSGWNLWLRL